ncbi:MAG: hypothetical protein A2Y72_03410 [Chloroflexi bacterium RBG_13_53_26]|jgi:hypothetical protein|nr:MAG: hypothetical protein A2Y72_03410 [Chloroflexi bacterium RBG_13_53_26]
MGDNILLGISRFMIPVPRLIWRGQVPGKARHLSNDLCFMSAEHHQVRNHVVRELPRVGKPMSPESIAQSVKLPIAQVKSILDDLEEHKTFLFRDKHGAVTWAYPMTVDKTPHHVALSSGEEAYAA